MKKINRIDNGSPPAEIKRTAAYARVSADSGDGQHSFEAQVSYYTRLISENPQWEFAGIYADEGVSGTESARRAGFAGLMADCEAGKIDLILTKSVSRFARNTVDLLEACRRLRGLGVEVRFEREQISTFTAEGELLLSITASIAQEESRSISDNIKWGIRKGFRRGQHNAFALYGYRQREGVISVVPGEAEVVRLIYDSYLAGNSVGYIERLLAEMGVRSYRGKHFSQGAIRDILRQEKYTGNMLLQKYYIRDHISHKKCRNNGELPQYYVENTHPAIIDAQTFERAQLEILRRRERGGRSCFTGRLRCCRCGGNFRRYGGGRLWRCSTQECPAADIAESLLIKACCNALSTGEFDGELFAKEVESAEIPSDDRIIFRLTGGETKTIIWGNLYEEVQR